MQDSPFAPSDRDSSPPRRVPFSNPEVSLRTIYNLTHDLARYADVPLNGIHAVASLGYLQGLEESRTEEAGSSSQTVETEDYRV